MAYTVFESINMGSTHYAERIFDCVCDKDIENGTFGYLGDLVSTGYETIYNFVPGTDDNVTLVVVDQPAWDEDECCRLNQKRDRFIIPAGTPFRVRAIKKGDEFGITIDGFIPSARELVKIAQDYVDPYLFVTIDSATGKLNCTTSSTHNAIMAGRIMRKRIIGGTLVTPLRTYGEASTMYEIKIDSVA